MMRFVYSAFGLRLAANVPLGGLRALSSDSVKDLQIWLKTMPPWLAHLPDAAQTIRHVSPFRNERGDPLLRIWEIRDGAYLRLLYDDGTQFILDRSATEVWATWPEALTVEDAATYLLGSVFGFILRLRGFVTLHASAVSIGDSAIAFVGPQGAGKSTTAAAFAGRGYAVLTDDIAALRELGDGVLIQPAYPQLNLWPNSVEALYGAKYSLPPLTPNWDKRCLDLRNNGHRFHQEPLRLAAIYFLNPRSVDAAAPFIETVDCQKGLIALVANSYGALHLDTTMRAREFKLFGRIAARVPLRRVTPHVETAHLSKMCEILTDDYRQVIQW